MTKDEALKLALEVLEELQGGCTDHDDGTVEAITVWCPEVISAIKEALEIEPDFGPQPDMHYGMNQDDWKDIVAAISKARDSRGIYLACRPADVFQDWFLAMGLFKPKEKANET